MGPLTAQQKRQKEKDKKRKEKERAEINAEHETFDAANGDHHAKRAEEKRSVAMRVGEMGLAIVEVPSDGNCLFHSIGVSMQPPVEHTDVRKAVVHWLTNNLEEVAPFFEDGQDGAKSHIVVVSQDGQWGSAVDLRAAASALQCRIQVVSASGVQCFGDETTEVSSLTIVHYERMFELGEHFCGTKLCQ